VALPRRNGCHLPAVVDCDPRVLGHEIGVDLRCRERARGGRRADLGGEVGDVSRGPGSGDVGPAGRIGGEVLTKPGRVQTPAIRDP
jgi:hypothetical protein